MDDELSDLGFKLSLTSEEMEEVSLPGNTYSNHSERNQLILIGRVLWHKPVNLEALKDTMSGIWSPAKGINIRKMSDDKLMFIFRHSLDRKKAIEGGPWAFDKKLIVLNVPNDDDSPTNVNLDWCDFHVQASGLPLRKMNKEVATVLGNKIGIFQDMDSGDDGLNFGDILRFRASINVTKPLLRAMRTLNDNGEYMLVTFRYERLPNFCYYCGVMDHISRGCEKQYEFPKAENDYNLPYGPWLRAQPPQRISSRHWKPNNGNHINPTFLSHTRPNSAPITRNRPTGKDLFALSKTPQTLAQTTETAEPIFGKDTTMIDSTNQAKDFMETKSSRVVIPLLFRRIS